MLLKLCRAYRRTYATADKSIKALPMPQVRKMLDASLSNKSVDNATSEVFLPRLNKNGRVAALISFKEQSNAALQYGTVFGSVRTGRLLEDLDTLAGWSSYVFIHDAVERGVSIVTALVDRIVFQKPNLSLTRDLRLESHVSWVGRSSLETTMQVFQEPEKSESDQNWEQVLEAKFVMAARLGESSAPILNPLNVETEQERVEALEGEQARVRRYSQANDSLLKVNPTEAEMQNIHAMFLRTIDPSSATFRVRVKPDNSRWMEDSILKNAIFCHPEQRNIYNKIFGGFLMRQAFEIGWANAFLYSGARPSIKIMDDTVFRCPVEIGSLLFLSSQVVFTEGNYMQCKVHAEVVKPDSGHHTTTNVFHFTFQASKEVSQIYPKSYAESMMFVDGQRHFRANCKHFHNFD